jgi:hypothetical protein
VIATLFGIGKSPLHSTAGVGSFSFSPPQVPLQAGLLPVLSASSMLAQAHHVPFKFSGKFAVFFRRIGLQVYRQ